MEIMMDKLNVIEDYDLLKKYDTIWDKVSTYIYLKKNLIANLSIIKIF